MENSPTPRRFFVYIVESPTSRDLLEGRNEGSVLRAGLELIGIAPEYSLVTDIETFDLALGPRLTEARELQRAAPVIHLSTHGVREGLCLTNGYFLDWEALARRFREVNSASRGELLLCVSSCYGLHGYQMGTSVFGAGGGASDPPFKIIIGNLDAVPWRDAAIAFLTFYHLYERGLPVESAISAMKTSSGNMQFFGMTAESLREKKPMAQANGPRS